MSRIAVIASAALMASTALAAGTATVINACTYDVYMANTPAEFGGYDPINDVLSAGDSYSQQYTELTNSQGWSIKLAKQPVYDKNLMQYEYTFHDDGTIWYDLSEVDGNPWDGDWMITATGDCTPRQAAYRFSTDDAYGMQACPDSSDITVTLCSGEDQADGVVASEVASGSSPAETYPAATTVVQATTEISPVTDVQPTTTTTPVTPTTTTTQQWGGWGDHGHGRWTIGADGLAGVARNAAPTPTTLVTKPLPDSDSDASATATEDAAAAVRRHAHHPHQGRPE